MPQQLPLGEELLTVVEAAGLLRCHSGTLRRWLLTGKLPGWRKGGRLAVLRRDLEAFIHPVVPAEPQPRRSTISAETRRELERRGYRLPA